MEGKTQETAAARAGISVRSARKWQSGPLPSETKQVRQRRTCFDPFEGVWKEEIEPLLRGDPAGRLKATTIMWRLDCRRPLLRVHRHRNLPLGRQFSLRVCNCWL